MQRSRRAFLQGLGAGVAFVSLPEISSIFSLFHSPSAADADLAVVLRRLFSDEGMKRGPFVAYAETTVTESSPQQLLEAPAALMGILDQLGVDNSFSRRVDYSDASQCRQNFERQEESWRKSLGNDSVYTDVRRAPIERDVAVLIGGKVDRSNNTLYHAEGATQYGQEPAVQMAGHAPGVILKAPAVIGEHIKLSDKEFAQALALIDKKTIDMDGGQQAHRYETPISSVIHIERPRRNNRVGSRAVGVIAVHNKLNQHNPNNIYFADLYV